MPRHVPGFSPRWLALALTLVACGEAPPGAASASASAASVPAATASVPPTPSSTAAPSAAAAGPCVALGAAYAKQAGDTVVLCDASGAARVVAEHAPDAEPTLSPSGRSIAFLRKHAPATIDHAGMVVTVADNEVIVADVVTREERAVANNGECLALHRPVFVDDGFLMFTARGYGGASARHTSVCGVDLTTKSAPVVSLASGADCASVISHGRYVGHLYVTGVSGTPPSEYARIVDRRGHTRAAHKLEMVARAPTEVADRQTGDYCSADLRLAILR